VVAVKKNILLGITGGIAAYKMVEVASRLIKMGHAVRVVMTEGGSKFVAPLTFQAITHNQVELDLFTPVENYGVKHISLAEWADICLIAPATANFIGKMAGGIADDLLSTLVLAANTPILIAPSMNVHMYHNPVFQDNLAYLRGKGYQIIEPEDGWLACGYEGKGRMPEPEILVEHLLLYLKPKDLAGLRVLITAGPTRESLDPVRYLSNYSSGKMGYALARSALHRGAEVLLISGPTQLTPPVGVKLIQINTAGEMEIEVNNALNREVIDIIIMTAAVADFRPAQVFSQKIKKNEQEGLSLKLIPNPDILSGLGQKKTEKQLLVGFAVESENLLENAVKKMKQKNLDMIIANGISAFAADNNEVTLITPSESKKLPVMEKNELADAIWDELISIRKN
jgi:phosphopantothenoylcysteine decarboxylase / phosphopantothenate---cysteine ligase